LVSHGYRNEYDIAFNSPNGDIFTYDSDMEWDAGTPWYRPTRICLATSGSELGWRSGSGKWPATTPTACPAFQDIGPGSPTGVESGKGAKFPAKYQHAIFANDWTYGTMYAIHLTPTAALTRPARSSSPANPSPSPIWWSTRSDGALYFAIGGRSTQSAVYRVTYTGSRITAPAAAPDRHPGTAPRQKLEKLHTKAPARIRAW
jgi:hypothetical protein